MCIAAAIAGTAVVGAYSADQASDAQQDSAREGMAAEERIAYENRALQRELADQQREDFAPWRNAGQNALDQIVAGVNSGEFVVPDNFNYQKDPGYQFRMDQGVEALDRSASARGRLLSGAQKKALTEYGQGMGSQEYSNAYAREANKRATKYNILNSLNTGGQASAAGQAQATSNLATTSGNILSNLGRSQNIAAQNVGAARASGYQGQAQSVNQAAQNWLLYNSLG